MSNPGLQWSPQQDERRAGRRLPVAWRARARLRNGHFVECRTADISKGGASVLCPQPFAMGGELQIALLVPDAAGSGAKQTAVIGAKVVFQVLAGHDYRISLQWTDPAAIVSGPLGAWMKRIVD